MQIQLGKPDNAKSRLLCFYGGQSLVVAKPPLRRSTALPRIIQRCILCCNGLYVAPAKAKGVIAVLLAI